MLISRVTLNLCLKKKISSNFLHLAYVLIIKQLYFLIFFRSICKKCEKVFGIRVSCLCRFLYPPFYEVYSSEQSLSNNCIRRSGKLQCGFVFCILNCWFNHRVYGREAAFSNTGR